MAGALPGHLRPALLGGLRARGKRLSVPEWGVPPGTHAPRASGGDNAFYIRKMVSFFSEQRDVLAYESYFNGNAAYYGGSLLGPVQVPKASTEYARQIRALAAGVPPGPTTVYRSGLPYSGAGVWTAAPRAVVSRRGVTVSADVAVDRPVTFARLTRIAIRDAAGRGSDARGSLDVAFGPATIRAGVTLAATRSLAPGSYTATVAYSLDGTTWLRGPAAAFTVG